MMAGISLLCWVLSFTIAIKLVRSGNVAEKVNGGIVLTLNVLGLIVVVIALIMMIGVAVPPSSPSQ